MLPILENSKKYNKTYMENFGEQKYTKKYLYVFARFSKERFSRKWEKTSEMHYKVTIAKIGSYIF